MIDETKLYRVLGERIRKYRESLDPNRGKMTQAELAQLVGLERTSITNIERGNQKVPLHVLYRLCDALKVSVTEMLPAPTEVRAGEEALALSEVRIFGETIKATPLVAQAVAALLTSGEDNGNQ